MRNKIGNVEAQFVGVLLGLIIVALISGLCWNYSLNHWLVYFDKPQRIAFWQACILGFVPFLGQASIPVAVITWILSLFI